MSSHWVLVVSTYDDHRTSPKFLVCLVFSYLLPPKTHKQTNISYHGKKLSLSPIFPPDSRDFHQKTIPRLPPPNKKESCPWRFTGNDTGSPGDFHLPGAIFFVEVFFFLSQFFFGSDFGSVWDEGFLTVFFLSVFFWGLDVYVMSTFLCKGAFFGGWCFFFGKRDTSSGPFVWGKQNTMG